MTGYFTKAERVLFSIFCVLILFFFAYTLAIVIDNKELGNLKIGNTFISEILYNKNIPAVEKVKKVFGNIIYFNLVTYTTLGYGDIIPTGILKLVSGIESLLGTILNTVLLIVLTRKMLR